MDATDELVESLGCLFLVPTHLVGVGCYNGRSLLLYQSDGARR